MKDLIIAVADGYQENVMEALLPRIPLSSNTRNFSYDIIKNPGKDPGSYNDSHELLRSSIKQYKHAIVIFDFEGTGVEHLSKDEMEDNVQQQLNINGWDKRNIVIVVKPEIENWMWINNNPNVEQAIGWEKSESLYEWAKNNNFILPGSSKPDRPKEVFEEAMRISETSKSGSIYKKIAATVSFRKCEDASFKKLILKLQEWFSKE